MKIDVVSPFYTIADDKLLYLNKYEICKLPLQEEIRKLVLKDEGVVFKKTDIVNTKDFALVIEPHPDDFALSALGYTLNKYNTIVLNVFSKMNIDSFTWKDKVQISEAEYEKLRLGESKLSVEKILGQQFQTLKEKSMRITDKDLKYIKQQIINGVSNILKYNTTINTILVPMGIGMHPDHLIVYDTLMNIYRKEKQFKIILYPEYPYARCRKEYNDRLNQINKDYKLKPIVIDVESKIDILTNAISAYRSQFDDINRNQMLAIIREDAKAIAQEYKKGMLSLVYYEIEEKI